MTEAPDPGIYLDETPESLLEQSQQNAQALILATISLLDDLGVVPEAWADGLAERFAAAWSDDDLWEPGEFLEAMLTNYRSLGAYVEVSSLDTVPATATISGFPDADLCDVFGIDRHDADVYHRVASDIARRLGLDWRSSVDDERVSFTVTTRNETDS